MYHETFKVNIDNQGIYCTANKQDLVLEKPIEMIMGSLCQYPKFYLGHIYFPLITGEIVKWDIETSKEIWRITPIQLDKERKLMSNDLSLTIYNNILYLNYSKDVYLISLEGKLIDKKQERLVPSDTILIENDFLLRTSFSNSSDIYKELVDAKTFRSKWQSKLKNGFSLFSLQSGSNVVFSDGDDTIQCLDFKTGSIVWTFDIKSLGKVEDPFETLQSRSLKGFPLIWNKLLIVGVNGGLLLGIDTNTGALKFQTQLERLYEPFNYTISPDGNLYISTSSTIFTIDPMDGKVSKQNDISHLIEKFKSYNHTRFNFTKSQLFVNDLKNPYCFLLDKETGKLVKSLAMKAPSFFPPYIYNNKLYLLDESGNFYQGK